MAQIFAVRSRKQSLQGWSYALISLFALTIGTTLYSTFGLVIRPMSEDLGVGIEYLSGVLSLALFSAAICAPLVGRWLDIGSIRLVMSTGLVLLGIAMLITSFSREGWVLGVIFLVLVGPALAMLTPMVPAKLVTNWFQENRGVAIAIVTLPLGPVLGPLVGDVLIAAYGWRGLYQAVVLLLFGVFVLVQFVRNSPQSIPDSDDTVGNEQNAGTVVVYLSLLKDHRFWITVIYVAILTSGLGTVIVHLVIQTTDKGLDTSEGAVLLSLFSAVGMLGGVAMGWCVDRSWGFLAFVGVGLAFPCLSLALFLDLGSYVTWLVVTALAGFTSGGLFVAFTTLLVRLVGTESFGTAIGLATTIILFFGAVAPYLAGVVYERIGGYEIYFEVQLVIVVLLSLCMWRFVKPAAEKQES